MNKLSILAIHFQYMNDGGKLARELFNSGKPFIASIVPNLLDKSMKTEERENIFDRIHSPDNYYPEWAKEIFKDNKDNPKVLWAQEGYRHCCDRCYNKGIARGKKSPDPYHEHICLDGHAQSFEKQIEVISKGKKLIEDELGIEPILYCPPNHLYDKNTLKAADKNEFSYFLTRNGFGYIPLIRNLIKLPALAYSGLILFPETKNGKSPVIMTYYDHICDGKVANWRGLLENSSSLYDLNISDEANLEFWISEKLTEGYKKLRDIKNSFL
jgi:hypothetical protein